MMLSHKTKKILTLPHSFLGRTWRTRVTNTNTNADKLDILPGWNYRVSGCEFLVWEKARAVQGCQASNVSRDRLPGKEWRRWLEHGTGGPSRSRFWSFKPRGVVLASPGGQSRMPRDSPVVFVSVNGLLRSEPSICVWIRAYTAFHRSEAPLPFSCLRHLSLVPHQCPVLPIGVRGHDWSWCPVGPQVSFLVFVSFWTDICAPV